MSAQALGVLVAGPEPPWLKADPMPYCVTSRRRQRGALHLHHLRVLLVGGHLREKGVGLSRHTCDG